MGAMARSGRSLLRAMGLLSLALALGILTGALAIGSARYAPSVLTLQGPEGKITLYAVGPAQWRIEAGSPRDQAFAEGVLDGLDAAPLLILRRAAAYGQLEALIGPEAAEADAWARERLAPVIARAWEALDAETRSRLEAYAAGVNTAWRMGIPMIRRLPSDPLARPWEPRDSLAVAAGLALAHPGWMEAEIAAALRHLPPAPRAALEDPRWSSATPAPDVARREAAWRAWAAVGAAPELGLFRTCQEDAGIRLHAMAAPVFPLPWRPVWVNDGVRLRWPGIPGALARIRQAEGAQLEPKPGPGDVLDALGELSVRIVRESGESPLWAWQGKDAWPRCAPPAMPDREALLALTPEDWLQRRVHGMLARWDGQLDVKSPSALVYEAWRWELIRTALGPAVGEENLRRLLARRPAERLRAAAQALWEAQGNEVRELKAVAYRRALAEIGRRYGDLHTIWEWGKAHAATVRIPGWPIRAEIPLGGDESAPWPTPVDPVRPFATAFWPALTVQQASHVILKIAPTPVWWRWP